MHHNTYKRNPFRKRPHIDDVVKRDNIYQAAYQSIMPANNSRYSVYDPSDPCLFLPANSSETVRSLENDDKSIDKSNNVNTDIDNKDVSDELSWVPTGTNLPLYVYNGMRNFSEKFFPISKTATFQFQEFTTHSHLPTDVVIDEKPKKTLLFHCPLNKMVKWRLLKRFEKNCNYVDIHIVKGWCRLISKKSTKTILTNHHSYLFSRKIIKEKDILIESVCNNELIMFLIFYEDTTEISFNRRIAYYYMLITTYNNNVRYIDYKVIKNVEGLYSLVECKITNESGSTYFDELITPLIPVSFENLSKHGYSISDVENKINEKEALDLITQTLARNIVYGYDLDALKNLLGDTKSLNIEWFDLKYSECIKKLLECQNFNESTLDDVVLTILNTEWSSDNKRCSEKLDKISDIICTLEKELTVEYHNKRKLEVNSNRNPVKKCNINKTLNSNCITHKFDFEVQPRATTSISDTATASLPKRARNSSPVVRNEIIISDNDDDDDDDQIELIEEVKCPNKLNNVNNKPKPDIEHEIYEIIETPPKPQILDQTTSNSQLSEETSPTKSKDTMEVSTNSHIIEEIPVNPQVIEDAMLDCDVDSPIELFADDYVL